MSARVNILKAIDDRIWDFYDLEAGSLSPLFRAHRIGALKPWSGPKPGYTLVDDGQNRALPGDNVSAMRVLSVRLVLHIGDTWEKEATQQAWSDRVESIIANLHGRPAGHGLQALRYVSDEPMDVVFFSGSMQADWIIDFEAEYTVEVDEFDDWTS